MSVLLFPVGDNRKMLRHRRPRIKKYRFLRKGDVIQKGDEIYLGHFSGWKLITHTLGHVMTHNSDGSLRRPIHQK